jgi:hypothetical protein
LQKHHVDYESVFSKSKTFLPSVGVYCLGAVLQVVRKHKRHKTLIALFFPAAIFLFLIGWVLCCIGSQKQPRKTQPERPKDAVHLQAIVLEEPAEIAN